MNPGQKCLTLVPDSVIIGLVLERLRKPDAVARGVVLDGFPRTAQQVKSLQESGDVDIDRLILLEASDQTCLDRVLNRRIDPLTDDVYNLKYCPPSASGLALVQRDGDNDPDGVRKRLQIYRAMSSTVLRTFKGKVKTVNADQDIDSTFKDFEAAALSKDVEVEVEVPKDSPRKGSKTVATVEQCVICMVNPANHLVVPCGHQCGCEECLTNQMRHSGRCPICRTEIMTIVKVFKSGIVDEVVVSEEPVAKKRRQEEDDDGGWAAAEMVVRKHTAIQNFELEIVDKLRIDVAPCEDINGREVVDVAVTLKVPDIESRIPVDICCVIDISGSMGEYAKFQDPNDEKKWITDNMIVLDVVKHAVKSVMHNLTPQDRLAVVAFESKAYVQFKLTEMNDTGRQLGITALEELTPRGSTNIWSGLVNGLNALREAPEAGEVLRDGNPVPRKKFLFLLTDGQPTDSPPVGEEAAMRHYFENFPDFKCQVSTFGFGYSLKSQLLLDVAKIGHGTFAFIPDAKIVGTCFVNAVSNACCNLSQNCTVHLSTRNNVQFAGKIDGNIAHEEVAWGYVARIGPLQYGQSRDLVVPLRFPAGYSGGPYLEVTVEYESSVSSAHHKITYEASDLAATADSFAAHARNHVVRTAFDVISECSASSPKGVHLMKALAQKMKSLEEVNSGKDARITALCQDVTGRMSKAISTFERWTRWGQHYLRAIVTAHQLQIRTNFMDVGLQIYGGSLSRHLEESCGRVFISLPMKKSESNVGMLHVANAGRLQPLSPHQQAPISVTQIRSAPVNLPNTTYYGGGGGGCFDPFCTVQVLGGHGERLKFLNQVRRGDVLRTVDGFAKVICVVQIERKRNDDLILFNDTGLKLTKRHPVWIDGNWVLPVELLRAQPENYSTCPSGRYVYNFILDRSHLPLVNGIVAPTFGHGIKEAIAWHPFYASEEITRLLSSQKGFETGFISVQGSLRALAGPQREGQHDRVFDYQSFCEHS